MLRHQQQAFDSIYPYEISVFKARFSDEQFRQIALRQFVL